MKRRQVDISEEPSSPLQERAGGYGVTQNLPEIVQGKHIVFK